MHVKLPLGKGNNLYQFQGGNACFCPGALVCRYNLQGNGLIDPGDGNNRHKFVIGQVAYPVAGC